MNQANQMNQMNLSIIEISQGERYRYKSEKSIDPGLYIQYFGQPSKEEKERLPLMATTDGRGCNFKWLIPAETWVLKALTGQEIEQELDSGDLDCLDLSVLEDLSKFPLRGWQARVLKEAKKNLSNNLAFRRGLNVGLGGGKTLVALILCSLSEKSLYIAPRHLHGTIKDESEKWDLPLPKITTPESARKIDFCPSVAIIDECLSVKNPDAARTKAIFSLLNETPVVLAMTGTPMSAKRALDLRWLRVCDTVLPAGYKQMMHLFGINPHPVEPSKLGGKVPTNGRGEVMLPLEVEAWDMDKLSRFVGDRLITVDISEILSQIPEKRYEQIELPQPKTFRAVLRGLLTERGKQKRIRQAMSCSSGFTYGDNHEVIWVEKDPKKIKWVKDFIEDNPDEPVVIFSGWRAEIVKLREELESYSPAVVADENSSEEAGKFTRGETNILICSAYLSEGMNLQRCRIGVFCSNSTSPYKRTQAEGRLFRPGQTRGVVFYDLVCRNTLDQKSLDLLLEHKEESQSFVESALNAELERLIRGGGKR